MGRDQEKKSTEDNCKNNLKLRKSPLDNFRRQRTGAAAWESKADLTHQLLHNVQGTVLEWKPMSSSFWSLLTGTLTQPELIPFPLLESLSQAR